MKRIIVLILLAGALSAATGQTLTISSTAVEVVTAGAKTRAFYAIDDVFFVNTSAGGFAVKDASNGTILFQGDTSEVNIEGAEYWSDSQEMLSSLCTAVPLFGDTYPKYYLPKRGLNYLYRNNGFSALSILHSKTKYVLWTGAITALADGPGVSALLAFIRHRIFQDTRRAQAEIGPTITTEIGGAAGSGGWVITSSRGTSGLVAATTGTDATTGTLCTITLPVGYDNISIQLTPANEAALAHLGRVYPTVGGTNTINIRVPTTALSDETLYQFYFSVSGWNDINND